MGCIKKVSILIMSLLFSILFSNIWGWSFSEGIVVCTSANNQQSPSMVGDDSGGAIIVWEDYRNGSTADIFAHHMESTGATLWTPNGVVICTSANNQLTPVIATDGSGGAIIAWKDRRNGTDYNIYAQKINSSGSTLWSLNGSAICTSTLDQQSPSILSDDSGGVFISWQDGRNGSNDDIYAQHLDSTGSILWPLNGLGICTATGNQTTPILVTDQSGGAIIAWDDTRSGSAHPVYAQRINLIGSTLWTNNGIMVSPLLNFEQYPTVMISDGYGGAIITWVDQQTINLNNAHHIFAQRINLSGSLLWALSGATVSTLSNDKYNFSMISDGSGGAVIPFNEQYQSSIYVQHMDSTGIPLWSSTGFSLSTSGLLQAGAIVISDGSGGYLFCWQDYRHCAFNGNALDIFAQHLNSNGSTLWDIGGIDICTSAQPQNSLPMVSDGSGGAIISWCDMRNGSYTQFPPAYNNMDIFIQSIKFNGAVPVELSDFQAIADSQNDKIGKCSQSKY